MSNEHPKVKRARLAVDKLNSLLYTLRCVEAQVQRAKQDLATALDQMATSGEPDQPWAAHWRLNLTEFTGEKT